MTKLNTIFRYNFFNANELILIMSPNLLPGVAQATNPYAMSEADIKAFKQALNDWYSNSGGKDLAEFMFARALAHRDSKRSVSVSGTT